MLLLRVLFACCLLAATAQAQSCGRVTACRTTSLKLHSKGTCVKVLQQVLFKSSAQWDGDFGKKTESAVMSFQSANGLVADGKVGPKTWAKIVAKKCPSPTPTPTPGGPKPQAGTCKPKITLPSWNGGTKEQLACAVKALAKTLGLPLQTQWAYIMGTVEWETGNFQPVREAPRATDAWRKAHLRYYPYYGRGYVQLTWKSNYQKYGTLIGCDFVSKPDLVMIPNISLYILVHGMAKGSFTGAKLSKYVTKGKTDFYNARRVINLLDRATEIKNRANAWLKKYSTIC